MNKLYPRRLSVRFRDGETLSHAPVHDDPPFGNPDDDVPETPAEPPLVSMLIRVESNGDLTVIGGDRRFYMARAGEWEAVGFELGVE